MKCAKHCKTIGPPQNKNSSISFQAVVRILGWHLTSYSYTVYTPSIEATYLNHSQSKFGFWQLRFCGPTLTFQAHSGSGIPTVVGLAAPTREDAEAAPAAAAAAAEMPPAPKPGTSTSRTLLLQNMFQPTKVGVDWD